MLAADDKSRTDFLSGAGEMGARIGAFNWSGTPLGPIELWPESLKTSVSLILGSRHPMWIGWGPEMTFLYNDAYLHVLGSAKHPRALGRPAAEVWAEIWDVCGPLADKVFKSAEATFVDDVRLFMSRGDHVEETFYSFSYSPIRDESGQVCGLFCPSTDVTPNALNARRLATLSEIAGKPLGERTAVAACATAASILAKNPDDIPFAVLYLADDAGARATLEQVVGCFEAPPEVGTSIDLTTDPCVSDDAPWPIAEVFRTAERQTVSTRNVPGLPPGVADQPVVQAVVLPVTSRGERQPFGVLVLGVNPCRPLDDHHLTFFELVAGQLATAIQNARAVEDQKKRADMLAELDRAKTNFFSNVSHEFRTPLTLMLGPLESLLAESEALRPEDRDRVVTAHRNSLRLLKLVSSLLDFSRIEAGRVRAAFALTDLATLTADLASNFRSAIQTAGLELRIECAPLPEPVYVDREMWEQIVLNLLSNAFKFTFEGGIAVRVEARGGMAVLTVSDTGAGIPAQELPRIFERFHRIEGTKGRTYEGTGIGLALIKELVELHRGRISAVSTPGKGSTFTVELWLGTAHLPREFVVDESASPMTPAMSARAFTGEAETWLPREVAGSSIHSASLPGVSGSSAKPRVLLADDNADMRDHVTRILGPEYEVVAARDGQEALDLLRRKPPVLLLTDIMMPGLDGFGLLAAVRSDPATQTLPVIFISARAGAEMRIEGLEAGADDYLIKPFTANELRARVATHVNMAIARSQAVERESSLRTQAEAARDQVVSVLEGITDGFFALDTQWRMTYVNAEAERLNGMPRANMLGMSIWERFPETEGTLFQRELQRAARDRVTVDFENYYESWKRWFHVKAYPAAEGGLSVFFEEITARKQAEAALRESEELFRTMIETTPECVKVVAADGTVLHMNSSGLAMVGASRASAVVGKSVYELIAPEFRGIYREFNEKVCRGEKGFLEFDIVSLHGQRRQMDTHAAPLRANDGTMMQIAITRDITEGKRSEQAARLLAAIVDSSDDAIVSKDLHGIITSWNKGAERLFGYTSDEVTGKPITVVIPSDRLDEEPEILRRLEAGERVDHFETVRRNKDGALLDVSLTISPVRDAQGKIIGASKIARDVTDRKRAEEAIAALNQRLAADLSAMTRMQRISTRLLQAEDFPQLLDEIVAAGTEITGADMGNIQLLEDGVLRIVSQRGFEASFLDFFDRVGHGLAACGMALEGGERIIVEDVSQSPIFKGKAREVMLEAGARAVQSTPLVSRSGHILGLFSTHYRAPHHPGDRELRALDVLARLAADLIERKRAEAQLLASEGRFRQLADSMPQIVWTARPDGYLDYFNERWYQFTGFSRAAFGDSGWEPILHPDDVQRAHDVWYAAVKNEEPYRMEYRFRDRHENRWRWFMGHALPVRDSAGQIVKWFGSFTDIDDQKGVEEELRRANQDLEQFAYSASHDLQEPLRSIKIYSELLIERHAAQIQDQGLEFLGYVTEGASRMEMLVRDILAYTQVTKVEFPEEDADANRALAAALANLDGAIVQSCASVTYDKLPSLRIHGTQLQQLFQNLIGNAIKYRSPERVPAVHIGVEPQSGSWVFSVRDNGIGIEPEYKEHVFGLFKRLHSGDQYSGTGIGLAICQRIVERYHGRIWVESQLGAGSTFYFTLPH